MGGNVVSRKRERKQLQLWREKELKYVDDKYSAHNDFQDDMMRKEGIADDSYWHNYILQYLKRAQIFGVDTPQGRQALAKCFQTVGDAVACVIRIYGDLPAPGVPSGEIRKWEVLGEPVDFNKEPLL